MTAVNCPMCELRFANRNERDWHLDHEHRRRHHQPPTERPVVWPWHADSEAEAGADAGEADREP